MRHKPIRTRRWTICFPFGENVNPEPFTINNGHGSTLEVHFINQSRSSNNLTPDAPVQSSENHQTQNRSSPNNVVQERPLATYDKLHKFLIGIRDQVTHFQSSHQIDDEDISDDLVILKSDIISQIAGNNIRQSRQLIKNSKKLTNFPDSNKHEQV